MGRFYFGQIVLAYISDGRGRTKERPALIISKDEENDAGEPLLVIALSTAIEDPCPSYHVRVHDNKRPDPDTGLSQPCVAKCNWIREIEQRRVIRSLGHMPDELLKYIVEWYDHIVLFPDSYDIE